jgi:hypothetical protein
VQRPSPLAARWSGCGRLLALFVAVQRGRISTYDSKIAVATARAITEGRLHLDPADDGYGWHVPYSHYGIGMPLVILPLHVLQQAFHTRPMCW